MESALRTKLDEQNVKVKNPGAVGALWRRTEAEARSTVQIAEAEAEAERALDGGQRWSTLRSNRGWRRRRGTSCRSS